MKFITDYLLRILRFFFILEAFFLLVYTVEL